MGVDYALVTMTYSTNEISLIAEVESESEGADPHPLQHNLNRDFS